MCGQTLSPFNTLFIAALKASRFISSSFKGVGLALFDTAEALPHGSCGKHMEVFLELQAGLGKKKPVSTVPVQWAEKVLRLVVLTQQHRFCTN